MPATREGVRKTYDWGVVLIGTDEVCREDLEHEQQSRAVVCRIDFKARVLRMHLQGSVDRDAAETAFRALIRGGRMEVVNDLSDPTSNCFVFSRDLTEGEDDEATERLVAELCDYAEGSAPG